MAVLTGNPDGSAAVDYTVNAAVGFPWVTGPNEAVRPVNHVLPAWDALAGYALAMGLLAAERHRAQTGEGQLVMLSLMDVALAVTSHLGFLAEASLNLEPRPRLGNDLFGTYARDFRTADGHYVIAVALTPRQWASLVAATGMQGAVDNLEKKHGVDFALEGARFEHREEISALVQGWIAARTLTQVGSSFDEHGVLWGPYQTFKDLLAVDPRCSVANPMLREVDQPGIGRYLRAGSPLIFEGFERRQPLPAPLTGADTGEVLRQWLGAGDAELRRLAEAGIIHPPE